MGLIYYFFSKCLTAFLIYSSYIGNEALQARILILEVPEFCRGREIGLRVPNVWVTSPVQCALLHALGQFLTTPLGHRHYYLNFMNEEFNEQELSVGRLRV